MSNPPASVDEYVNTLEPWQRDVAERLRAVVSAAAPGSREAIKWRQPVFVLNGNMCYLSAFAGHINFGFFRGTDIPDPYGLLTGTGRSMRHVVIRQGENPPETALRDMVRAAAALQGQR
ncbi:MAG: DUF1801 domain-containing protein [Chloroflexota bacterium]